MKKWICLLLSMLLLCGCAAANPEDSAQTPTKTETGNPTEATGMTTVPISDEEENVPEASQSPIVTDFAEVENPIDFFSISLGENYSDILQMTVFYNEDGSVYLEYVGEEKKVGQFDANVMHGITTAFLESGLTELNGQQVYEEGEAFASMYVSLADGTSFTADYSGQIPQAFQTSYETMDQFFTDLTSELPVYVPRPLIQGAVEEDLLKPVMDILDHSGIEALDAYTITQVPKDEFFAFTAGLSSDVGIEGAVICAPMMITEAYSLVIVKLDDAKAEDVCADFEKNLDWQKWVCVAPDRAMIAVKDNMVLCLMGYYSAFSATEIGIRETGWTEVKTLDRP